MDLPDIIVYRIKMHDLAHLLKELWHEWRKLISAVTLLLALLTNGIPAVRTSPAQRFIAPVLITARDPVRIVGNIHDSPKSSSPY